MIEQIVRSRRLDMVASQIERRGVTDDRVLEAMRKVPRHLFVGTPERTGAYEDRPAPIGYGQTISQPYIVARMSELLEVEPGQKVLEIGTGSGYQTAVLAELGADVYTIEVVPELAESAATMLEARGYDVHARCSDGYLGWPEHAPFDAIIVTAAPPELPEALLEQLKPGGRMVIPVGVDSQKLKVLRKASDGSIATDNVASVRFVPMVHRDSVDR